MKKSNEIKMNSVEEKEQSTNDYIADLGDVLTQKEYTFLMCAFYLVKDDYKEDRYFDVIQNCCETLCDSRKDKLSNRDLFQRVLRNVRTSVDKENKEGMYLNRVMGCNPSDDRDLDASECLRRILALFDMDAMDKVKDDIFLRVLGEEDKSKVAALYHTTEENVDSIYTEKLAIINGIRVKDGKVYVEEEENYSEKLNDELEEIHKKMYYVDNNKGMDPTRYEI